MSKFTEPSDNATLNDVVVILRDSHNCMEEKFAAAKAQATKDRKATIALIQRYRSEAEERAKLIETRVSKNEDRFKEWLDAHAGTQKTLDDLVTAVGANKKRPSLASMSQFGAATKIGTLVFAAMMAAPLAAKFIDAVWRAGAAVLLK